MSLLNHRPRRNGDMWRFDRLMVQLAVAMTAMVFLSACERKDPDALMQSARNYLAAKNYAAAAIELKNVLQVRDSGEARYLLGAALSQAGDYQPAAFQLRRALEAGYAPDKVYPELATAMLTLGEVKKLIAEIPGVKLTVPASIAVTSTVLGEALLLSGNIKEAQAAFSAALASVPDFPPGQVGSARVVAKLGDPTAAEKSVDELLGKFPELPQALFLKAELLVQQSKVDQGIPYLERLIKYAPFDRQAHMAYISVLTSVGKFDAAAAGIAAMKKSMPKDVRANYLEALLEFRRGESVKARNAASIVLNALPDHAPSMLLSGAVEYQLGSLATAENFLRKVVMQHPNSIYARSLLIATYLRKGEPGKAEDVLAPALKSTPNDPTIMRAAGEVAFANNQLADAAKYYERALAIEKDNAQLKTRLAQIRLARGETNNALAELEIASALDKDQFQADLSLVAAFLQSKQYDKALAAAGVLERKQPNNPLTHGVKGVILLARQDTKAARTSLEKALSLQFNYLPAARLLGNLDIGDKKPRAAKERFEAILQREPTNDGALISLAETLVAMRSPAKEITATIERAIKANPLSVSAHVALIKYHLQNRNPRAALTAAQAANAAIANNARILDMLGLSQLSAGETGQAIDTFNKLAAVAPESTLPLMRLASAQFAANQVDAPIQVLRKALSINPELLEARREIIAVQLSAGRADEALKETKALQTMRPKSAIGYALEGDVLASQKRYSEASVAYGEALKREQTADLIVKQYGNLRNSGKNAEATALATQWLKDHPDDTVLRFSMANEALQSNDYKGAMERFNAILAKQPDNAAVLNNMAWVLSEMKDATAVGFAERAFNQAPNNPEILDTYGWLLVESGNTKRGIEVLSQAVAAAPKSADIRMHLAKGYLKAGDKVAAKRELETLSRTASGKLRDEAAQLLRSL